MISKAISKNLLALCGLILLVSCAQQSYPMQNPQTGETVMCRSGLTFANNSWASDAFEDAAWDSGPGSQQNFADACIHACERRGFRYPGLTPQPAPPPRNLAAQIPDQCR